MNTKFNYLTIVEDGLILKNERNKEREISFSELDKIFIKIYRLKERYKLAILLFLFLLIFISIQYITLEKVILLGLITVTTVFVKVNTYKSYQLIVCLNDGTVFKKKVPLNARDENISIISAVRREQIKHFKNI
jgi:hypothetical protein